MPLNIFASDDEDDAAAAAMVIIDCIPAEEAPGSRWILPGQRHQPRSLQVKAGHQKAMETESTRVQSLDQLVPKPTSDADKLTKVCDSVYVTFEGVCPSAITLRPGHADVDLSHRGSVEL